VSHSTDLLRAESDSTYARHYNSFHAELGFFLHLDKLIEQLEETSVKMVNSLTSLALRETDGNITAS
jgi:hypothetical protein